MAEPHEAQARVEQLERIEKCLTDRIATRDREVDELGSEVDALKQERDSLQIAYEDAVTEAAMQESYRKDIQKEAETLRTALRKYADGNNWVCPRCGKRDSLNCFMGKWTGPVDRDDAEISVGVGHGYDIARTALSGEQPDTPLKLEQYVQRQEEWSSRTFGHGPRTLGVTRHIEKEIAEIRENPHDLSEWVDVVILALDGYWRHGGDPREIMKHLTAKQEKNFARQWPTPTSQDDAVEHVRAERPDTVPAQTDGRVVEEKGVTQSAPCPECGGTEQVVGPEGSAEFLVTCPTCKGTRY